VASTTLLGLLRAVYAAEGTRYPRSAFWTSPVLASVDSVVDTAGRARPALVATWPAVSASPLASAARTDVLVAPRTMRPLVSEFEAVVCRVRAGRIGQRTSQRQRQREHAAARQEAELADGHANVRYSAYFTHGGWLARGQPGATRGAPSGGTH
jgi:hypothetical protein